MNKLNGPLPALISRHANGRVVAATTHQFYTQVTLSLDDINAAMTRDPGVVFAEIEDATCVSGFSTTEDKSEDFYAARDMADQMRDIMRYCAGEIAEASAVCDARFTEYKRATP
ncbi:MAG TPA: hypothetical protein DCS97_06730 [Planctomycetes bacterium]|nr:hypothetical protein [Planctomycetota bacterium]